MRRRTFLGLCGGTVLVKAPAAEAAPADIAEGFRQPPPSARPFTWWHWMNGNITADGITRDLEAMARIGVGGVQIFQVGTGIPKGPVAYGSPEHFKLLEHAAREADRLGLAFEMHNCPGWSSSGGPWITPEFAMQQMVWSETRIRGGGRVEVVLPRPPSRLDYYRDACVLAFPSLPGETQAMEELLTQVSSSTGPVDPKLVIGSGPAQGVELRPVVAGQPAYLQCEFREPFLARSVTLWLAPLGPGAGFRSGGPSPIVLEASEDGATFRKVAELGAAGGGRGGELPVSVSFAPVRARYFRLVVPQPRRVSGFCLSGAARLPDWPVKANFTGRGAMFGPAATPPALAKADVPPDSVIDPDAVVDLSRFMDAQGKLSWDAPPGNWTILRIGHTPVGTQNHPAPDGGLGLECDKYSRAAMDYHFEHFFGKLLPVLRPLAEKGLAGALIDSYEVGFQNWTPEFPQEFRRRRGYDLRRYLPAMTGRIVGSPEISERFLWDVRRTQADMMADNYYGRFAELCRKHGLKAYTEPYEGGPFDEVQIGSRVDVPMGEFWIGRGNHRSVKLASSVAHVYGMKVVGAESFTGAPQFSKWQEHPYSMKALGDWMFAQGINRYIFHRYAHQPHPDAVPGMTMGPWGFHFDRTNTWWEPGRAWLQYVTRCQYLLQEGLFVADLLYFEGETAPLAAPSRRELDPPPPPGYDWDVADREAVLKRLEIRDGRIVLPDGMSYRVLVLRNEKAITLELLRKLRDLVRQGMWLVGSKPEGSPSLAGHPQSDAELRRMADEMWGELDGNSVTERAFGQGRVFWGRPLSAVLAKLDLKPDFEYSARNPGAEVNYIHRRAGDTDIYFIANRRRRTEDLVCTFRVSGKQPELWNPVTGEIIPAGVYQAYEGRTRVALRLDPSGSMFVVFRNAAKTQAVQAVEKDGVKVLSAEPFTASPPVLRPALRDNFTVSVWLKPDIEAPLPSEGRPGFLGGLASFVLYPPEGEALYGAGHVCCGMMAGRNGVAIYERGRGAPVPVLTVPSPLAGWTHVAVVYRDGAPAVYIDGKLARQGQRSAGTVHPGAGHTQQDLEIPYFEGDMSEPELLAEPLSEERIAKLAAAGPPAPDEPPPVELAGSGAPELLVWQEGRYQLRGGTSSTFQVTALGKPMELEGPWRVSFPPRLGAPPEITLPQLISLHRHSDPGVRYFSGTATYTKRFRIAPDLLSKDKRLYLDLGRVEVMAEVRLNGRNLGIFWKPPFRIDVTEAVRAGENELEVRVTNLWVNRLIGDEQLPEENEYGGAGGGMMGAGAIRKLPDWYLQGKPKPPGGRVTFTTWKHHTKDAPLVESGLIGPVRLRPAVRRPLAG